MWKPVQRRSVLAVAITLSVGVGVLPLVAAYYFSRQRAIETERRHLVDYATWTLQRADLALSRAKNALKRLSQERHELCSASHLERLRQMTTDVLSVEIITVYRDGRLACDSWGAASEGGGRRAFNVDLTDGFTLTLDTEQLAPKAPSMISLNYGPYEAQIKRDRLVDVLHDTPMVLGIASLDGRLIMASGKTEGQLLARLAKEAQSGASERQVFSSVRGSDFIAMAISERNVLDWRVDGELWKLTPLGLIVSAILILLIGWVSRQRLSLAGELAAGIQNKEFIAHYQPIIELSTGRCVGAEALIRWPRPDGSCVRPDLFIPVAEHHSLIDQITDLMIERVCIDMKSVLRDDNGIHIAINISPSDIETGRFLPVLERLLRAANIKSDRIWIEATERGFMNANAARRNLEAARRAGHKVAIDDFGTGYSSLSLLEALPLNVLKMDKSFVDAIGHKAALSVVVPHIIDMAHGLNLAVVAEGVETAEQEDYLRERSVEFAQGWRYSKALPAREFVTFFMVRNATPPR